MTIEFARGDSYERGLTLRNKQTQQPITETYDEVYFTAKKLYTDKEARFQKRMTEGGIVNDGPGHYVLYIYPEDTDGLPFGEYDFDFEFVKDRYKKTFSGTLTLLKETTHANNE